MLAVTTSNLAQLLTNENNRKVLGLGSIGLQKANEGGTVEDGQLLRSVFPQLAGVFAQHTEVPPSMSIQYNTIQGPCQSSLLLLVILCIVRASDLNPCFTFSLPVCVCVKRNTRLTRRLWVVAFGCILACCGNARRGWSGVVPCVRDVPSAALLLTRCTWHVTTASTWSKLWFSTAATSMPLRQATARAAPPCIT